MVKTQIQLPDDLYARVRRLAAAREMSMAEVLRQGAEYMVRTNLAADADATRWKPPRPVSLGLRPEIEPKDLRLLANEDTRGARRRRPSK
jgi:hypothetical protein